MCAVTSLMSSTPRKYGIWLALGIGCAVILLFYGKFIFSPNSYLFSPGGDGIKNYYTFAWHVQYDSSYTHFRGMNHPWGEHVVFTDNQPLISNAARFVNNNITPVGNVAVGINNLLLFIGLLVAIGILYKLFLAFTNHQWFAVAAAVAVGMMSPQIDRFDGHFALAYCFVVPLFIWWLYRFFEKPVVTLSLAMGLTLLLLLFIHVYYLVIVDALVLCVWLVFLVSRGNSITLKKAIPHLFIQIVLPFGLYFLWLKLTDTVTDRPTQPYGIVEYAAYWEGLLLPLDYDYFKPLKQALGVRKVSVETIAYAGLPVLLFVLWAIGNGIYSKIKTKKETEETPSIPTYNQQFLRVLLLAACMVFVYAAFVPFLFNIPSISKYLGLLKQFRSLGRLLWVVFYGLNIFMLVYVFTKVRAKSRYPWLPWAMVGILAVESVLYNIHTHSIINNPRQPLAWVPQHLTPEKYEAIIPIPFYHEGSENIGKVPLSDTIVGQSMLLSWQTGIPLQAVKMSRTSLAQTLQQLEMGYEITQVPALLKKATKPYLLLHFLRDSVSLPFYRELHPIVQTDSFRLYEITAQKLETLIQRRAKHIIDFVGNKDNETAPCLLKTFENRPNKLFFEGIGALEASGTETTTLIDTTFTALTDSISVSFWIYARTEGLPQLKLLVDEAKGTERVHVLNHVQAVMDDWMLVEYNYTTTNGKARVQLLKDGAKPNELLYIDNLLVRPARWPFIQQKQKGLVFNNRHYR